MKTPLLIAIDGPSASGKGSLAKRIALHFGLPYLNTGALYRLAAWRVMERKIDVNDFENEIADLVKNISESDLELEELFSEKVGAVASMIAKNSKLRTALFDFQKSFSSKDKNGCVLDGRDTTTIICPNANYKFFITADVEIRAQRRFDQLIKKGDKVSYDEILNQLKKRDENDFNRAESPLKISADAVVIDNGNLSIEEGFQKILQTINS